MTTALSSEQVLGILEVAAAEYERRARCFRRTIAELRGTQASARKAAPRQRRDAGGLHDRILAIVAEAGSDGIKPAEVVAASKLPDWQARLTLKELAADGKIASTGATINKRFFLRKVRPQGRKVAK